MKSWQFRDYGIPLELVESKTPAPTGTEVVLRTLGCGVCHSDIHVWEGQYDLGHDKKLDVRSGRPLPFTLGHEIAGEVVALGPDARGIEVGARVVAYPWIGCGDCDICARDGEHLCFRPRALGTFRDGGFADTVLVPHPRYLFDYGDVPTDLACTYACSGLTAYSALKKVGNHPGSCTVIMGAGGVGLAAVAVAKATSQRAVGVVDIDAAKLAAATALGADWAVDASAPDAAKELKRLSGGPLYAVVDCVGAGSTAALGLKTLTRSGTLVVVGMLGGALDVALPLLPLKNLTIRGSYLGSLEEMNELMALVRTGKVKPIPRATRSLADAQRTLDDLAAGTIVGRVVLTP